MARVPMIINSVLKTYTYICIYIYIYIYLFIYIYIAYTLPIACCLLPIHMGPSASPAFHSPEVYETWSRDVVVFTSVSESELLLSYSAFQENARGCADAVNWLRDQPF